MNLLDKSILKLKIEIRFLLEEKWGIKKAADPSSIRKHSLKKYLPRDAIIIDCGAHNGSDSVELTKVFPGCKVHSFEPIPSIFDNLKRNTRKYPNIHCYQLALSNQNGYSKMYVSSGNSDASSSLLQPTGHLHDHPDVFFEKMIDIPTLTLDSWAEINKIKQIDFLWLDMQGFEFAMLSVSAKILPGVKVIHTEVSTRRSYDKAVLYPDLRNFLESSGFEVIIEAIPTNADMGNVVFVRKELIN